MRQKVQTEDVTMAFVLECLGEKRNAIKIVSRVGESCEREIDRDGERERKREGGGGAQTSK